jgi:hypothetical protein
MSEILTIVHPSVSPWANIPVTAAGLRQALDAVFPDPFGQARSVEERTIFGVLNAVLRALEARDA